MNVIAVIVTMKHFIVISTACEKYIKLKLSCFTEKLAISTILHAHNYNILCSKCLEMFR